MNVFKAMFTQSRLTFEEQLTELSKLRAQERKIRAEIEASMALAEKLFALMDEGDKLEKSITETETELSRLRTQVFPDIPNKERKTRGKKSPQQSRLNEPMTCKHGCGETFTGTTLEYAIHVKLKHLKTHTRRQYKSKYAFRALKNDRARCNTCMTVIKRVSLSQHYRTMHPEIAAKVYRPHKTGLSKLGFQAGGSNELTEKELFDSYKE